MKNNLSFILLICLFCTPCFGSPFAKVIRKASKVGDSVPVRQMEHLAKSPATSKSARSLIEKEATMAGRHLDDVAYNRELVKTLEKTLTGVVDPATLKTIKSLDAPTQEALLLVARGSKNIEKNIPDIAMRSNFMRNASGETLAALGRGDDKFVKEVIDINTKIGAKTLKSPPGMRSLSLDDVGTFFQKTGDSGRKFWEKSVRPHWKLWLGGTALAAILLAPEDFLDSVGELTKEGFKKVVAFGGDLLGDALAGTTEGMAEAGKSVIKKPIDAIKKSFFSDVWGVLAFIGYFLAGLVVLWIIPITRPIIQFAFRIFCPQKQPPQDSQSENA